MNKDTPEQSAPEIPQDFVNWAHESAQAAADGLILFSEQKGIYKAAHFAGSVATYRVLNCQPIPSLRWVYLYERLLKTAKRATDDYFRVGDCNGVEFDMGQLMVVIKEIEEESLLPVQPETKLPWLKELIAMAEDGYKLHRSNAVHQEFLEEDREILTQAKSHLAGQPSIEPDAPVTP